MHNVMQYMYLCFVGALHIAGAPVGSGPISTVPALDTFGLTKFNVMAKRQTLVLAHTEAGAFTTALTYRMSLYRAFRLRFQVTHFQVRTSTVHIVLVFRVLSTLTASMLHNLQCGGKFARMIKRLSHGCFHYRPVYQASITVRGVAEGSCRQRA